MRDPKESLDKLYKSNHRDGRDHLEEAMKIFGMTEADLAETDDELEFEQVVEFKADYWLVVKVGRMQGNVSCKEIRSQICK